MTMVEPCWPLGRLTLQFPGAGTIERFSAARSGAITKVELKPYQGDGEPVMLAHEA